MDKHGITELFYQDFVLQDLNFFRDLNYVVSYIIEPEIKPIKFENNGEGSSGLEGKTYPDNIQLINLLHENSSNLFKVFERKEIVIGDYNDGNDFFNV